VYFLIISAFCPFDKNVAILILKYLQLEDIIKSNADNNRKGGAWMKRKVRLQGDKARHSVLRTDRLKALRQKSNLTQKELGEKIGLTNKTISNYEKGDRQPNNEALLELARLFGVSVSYLLGETDNQKLLDNTIVILTDKDLKNMPIEIQETVLTIIDTIKKKHGS
jgi:transcriptional regulator with XRE-family HTH domain